MQVGNVHDAGLGSTQGEQRWQRLLSSRFPPSASSYALKSMPRSGPLGEMPDGMRRGVASPVHRRRSVMEERRVDSLPGADVPFLLRRVDSLPSLG
eukprot:831870-Pelagomonas_calceolata.AAC.1